MRNYDELLGPSSRWMPLLERGLVTINRAANRLVWNDGARKGRFAARLVPSFGLLERTADLPTSPLQVAEILKTTSALHDIAPALEAVQFVSTVGAIASVANVAVSIVGFAAVMHKLGKIDAKLDELLSKTEELQIALRELGDSAESFFIGRLRAAHEHLDRAISAESAEQRLGNANRARDLFLEARKRHLALWECTQPWTNGALELDTARELHGRYVAAAVGELQSEFLLGDRGSYVHSAESIMAELRDKLAPNPQLAFRVRSEDLLVRAGKDSVKLAVAGGAVLPLVASGLKVAAASSNETLRQVEAARQDADLPELLSMAPHEIARAVKEAPGVDIYALGIAGDLE